MNKISAIIFLLLSVSSSMVMAACSPDACNNVYIEKLYVVSDGTVYVGTSGDESILNCKATSGVYVTLAHSHAGSSKIYSTLLAAQLANKKIDAIQVDDASTGCVIQYVTLKRQ